MEQPSQQIFDPTKWYTLQIHLNYDYDEKTQKDKVPPIEFKDMTADQIVNTRRIIWQQGIIISTSPIGWELIDPLKIRCVYVLQQPSKFGI